MTREEAIRIIKTTEYYSEKNYSEFREALSILVPELYESEDERMRKCLIHYLRGEEDECEFNIPDMLAWLEKQKALSELGKYIAAKRTKPGFMFAGNDSVSWEELPLDVRKHDYPYYFSGDLDCYPFVVEKQKEQKPVEWSEEEIEEMVTKRSRSTGTTKSEMGFYRNGIKDAIKRFGLRPSWKPSEEQIKALESCFCEFGEGCPDEDGLRSLYNDLKRL